MSLTLSLGARALMLDGFGTFINSSGGTAVLVLRQTNLVLVSFSLNATPFAAAFSDSIIMTSPPVTNAALAVVGNANNFLLNNEAGVLALSGTVSAIGGGGDIEAPSVAVATVTIGAQRLNTFIIRMSSKGLLTVEASLTLV